MHVGDRRSAVPDRRRRDRRLRFAVLTLLSLAATLQTRAHAQSSPRTCGEAFAAWSATSQATVRTTGGTAAKAGGTDTSCIGSERERQALSRGLASVKRRCEAADANATEAAATLPLLAINADMVARLPLCTNAGATTAGGGACLDLQHTAGIYWLSNAACGDRTMIGVVEIRLSTGIVKCRGHVVAKPVKLGTSKPTINFECARNSTDCTVPSVRAMFPWCAW